MVVTGFSVLCIDKYKRPLIISPCEKRIIKVAYFFILACYEVHRTYDRNCAYMLITLVLLNKSLWKFHQLGSNILEMFKFQFISSKTISPLFQAMKELSSS